MELVSIQVVGAGLRDASGVPDAITTAASSSAPLPARKAYFGDTHGWLETPVVRRSDLATPRQGPLIVEEYDATCVVPPGARVELDRSGNMVIELA